MSRYAAMFERLRAANEGALGAFLMLGDPDPATCLDLLDAAVAGGADMIEVGIPFSDPVADGPVIQQAAIRALAAGVRTADAMAIVAEFRVRHLTVPIGILTYANIVVARGLDAFVRGLAQVGADSLLVADVPSLEVAPWAKACKNVGIDPVLIAAPNTPTATIARIAVMASGYTYCVARSGVTGASDELALDHHGLFEALAAAGAPPPVLGFGISKPDHVRAALRAGAQGVIVGSALVRLVEGANPAEAIRRKVAELKAATKR